MMMRIATAFILICMSLMPVASGARIETVNTFAAYADSVLNETVLQGTSWSILISQPETGEIVYERDPDRLLVPASVTKVVTSSAAFARLGADFRYETPCYITRTLAKDGSVDGDLLLQASGDPSAEVAPVQPFGVPLLRIWADSLRAHGLRRIKGNLVLNTWPYIFEAAASEWEIGDVNAGFAPAVDGFGYNSNVCHLAVQPGKGIGEPATLAVDPPFAPVSVKSRVTTAPVGQLPSVWMQVTPGDTSVVLSGEIPLGDDGEFFWIPVQDPALYFARAFREALDSSGIKLDGKLVVEHQAPPAARAKQRPFYTHRSAELREILAVMNKQSDNYIAEYMLRAVGRHASGVASRQAGLNSITEFLAGLGIDRREYHFEDGSGLARQNIISARAVTRLLWYMLTAPDGEIFRSTFAVAGVDGTLGRRLSEPDYRGRFIGKTGTMTRISGLAGYVTTRHGDVLSVAILSNNFRTSQPYVRATQDLLVARLISGWRKPS